MNTQIQTQQQRNHACMSSARDDSKKIVNEQLIFNKSNVKHLQMIAQGPLCNNDADLALTLEIAKQAPRRE